MHEGAGEILQGVHERRFDDRDTLARELALSVRHSLDDALRERDAAALVVSGGSTPLPFFRELARLPLDWRRVWITLADERWVEARDEASNEGLVRRELLVHQAAVARFVGLKTPAATPEQGAGEAWARLGAIPRPFDVVVLGMGEDGHFASMFPDSPASRAALDPHAAPACAGTRAPGEPRARITLNLAALAQTRRAVLHITGDHKWRLFREAVALAAAGAAPAEGPPVLATLRPPLPSYEVWRSP